jgi:hypothetical protein
MTSDITNNTMAKRQKDKHGSTKHTHKAKDRVTRNQGWTQVLWKSKQFLLRMWHTYIVNNIGYRHHDLVNRYGLYVSQMTLDIATMTWLTITEYLYHK